MPQNKSRRFSKSSTALDVVAGLDLTGKTYLVTGANSGIGLEVAKALAIANGHVVLACRSPARASEAKDIILEEKDDAKVDLLQLDLTELRSVEDCAATYQRAGWPLNCLILNAGLIGPQHKVTDDGFETTFQVNHLAQYYLTTLLLPQLKASTPARVVVVSSDAHKTAFLGPEDITWETLSPTHKNKLNSDAVAYSYSKFCNVLFANHISKLYTDEGITANSLHPGVVKTKIMRNYGLGRFCLSCCLRPMVINQEQGAATPTYLATAPELDGKGGGYYIYCKPAAATSRARSVDSAERLWSLSEEMINHYKQSVLKQLGSSSDGLVGTQEQQLSLQKRELPAIVEGE